MADNLTAPYGAFILRISMGLMFLAHACVKLFVFTPAGTAQFFASLGLPSSLAYVVMAAELLGVANRKHRRLGSQSSATRAYAHCTGAERPNPRSLQLGA